MNQPFIASFSGTAIEVLETVAIAYALILAGFAREAVFASILGVAVVCVAAVVLWPVHALFPVYWLQLGAGLLLTGMGIQWTQKSLRKLIAHKRARWVTNPLGGFSPKEDEATPAGFSKTVFVAMMKSTLVEGFEVMVVVFPIAAATGNWGQVAIGVAAGLAAVLFVAVVLHGQLKKVPEVYLKLMIGVLLVVLGLAFLVESV